MSSSGLPSTGRLLLVQVDKAYSASEAPGPGLGTGAPCRTLKHSGSRAGGSDPAHGAAPASFQAPADACELGKHLTEMEPNTRLPQKY